ncbi:CopK family periplasmic copper-binding protein [Rhodoferax sp.]|uniref:CopK family periplasmic copper-binding protein n=1 Tax=Rhodoferax sp. TaxID=50421 RepID=UPI0025CEAA62|nr:CopK family periplasmic copper-binding protein [Rhodoferax sp.]MCM2295647.1 CopK family periplasmic copper-binding protein [Rhodoferax sp.]
MSIRKSILVLSLVFPALSAFALDNTDIVKSTQLKDGSTVYQFKDGKMAMESKFGIAVVMQEGTVMETASGESITMKGNEVARLSGYIYLDNRP